MTLHHTASKAQAFANWLKLNHKHLAPEQVGRGLTVFEIARLVHHSDGDGAEWVSAHDCDGNEVLIRDPNMLEKLPENAIEKLDDPDEPPASEEESGDENENPIAPRV